VYQGYEGLFTVNEEEIKDLFEDPLLLLINYGPTGGVYVWLFPRVLSLQNERTSSCGVQLVVKTFLCGQPRFKMSSSFTRALALSLRENPFGRSERPLKLLVRRGLLHILPEYQ
jgi:hypothetical protein